MNITTSITLNMQTPGYVVAYEPQGNKLSRFITATLKNGSASWSVPSGATAMIRVAKPDGTFAVYDKNEKGQTAYTISGSTVTIELVGAALAAAGDALVTVMFLDSTGSNLSPFSFRLVIMPTAVSDDDIASSDYFNVFQDTINQLQAFYGAPLTAATASAMTDTTRVYVYVGSESGYVYGHWYYYNGSTWVNGGVYNSEGINSNWLYASYPTETISNAVLAHFNDGADDVPVKTLRIAINPVQSGTGDPSPDNVRPISGWTSAKITRTGSNLISPFNGTYTSTSKGVTYTFANANVTINGTSTDANADSGNIDTIAPIILKAGQTYTFAISGNWTTPTLRLILKDIDRNILWLGDSTHCQWTVTPETDLTVQRVQFRVRSASLTFNNVSGAFYCNLGGLGSLGAYEPYKGEVYEVSFGTAGTIYGGTLNYNGDGTWELSVDHYSFTVAGDQVTWVTSLGNNLRTSIIYIDSTVPTTGQNAPAISNWLPCVRANYSADVTGFYFYSDRGLYIKVPVSAVGDTTLEATKSYFDAHPLIIVYPLATPLTYTLAAQEVLTLLGINNIWADTGDIEELAYRADIGLYLMEALNPIKEMLAYREDGMTATRAYTTGDFIVVGDTFYKVTVSIANGATLTPGTNVNATTVGAQLKLLS